MNKPKIHSVDVTRFFHAARVIEDDMEEGYYFCRDKYGPEVAGALLIAALRVKFNDNPNQWPPKEAELDAKVREFLTDENLLDES